MQGATHFNPVDLVCAVKNYKGEKYDLLKHLWFLESDIPIYGYERDGAIMVVYSFCPDNPKIYKRSGEFHHFTRERRMLTKRPLKVKCK